MPQGTALTRRRRIDWTVTSVVLLIGIGLEAYSARQATAVWLRLVLGLAILALIVALLAGRQRAGGASNTHDRSNDRGS